MTGARLPSGESEVDLPAADADLVGFYRRLGIPGVVDVHVHFMPERLLQAVWRYFDRVPSQTGLRWQIHYRLDEPARLETLYGLGVLRHTALLYPHKPGMAASLNEWAVEFARRVPRAVPSGTFFAEPSAAGYVRSAVDSGIRVFKSHLQVGAYDPADPTLEPVWGLLAEAGIPVVCHCGDGPERGAFTGPGPISTVLARHPRLTLVIAHCGTPEYADFLALAARYPNVHLDTTMVLTDFTERWSPFPRDLLPRLADLGEYVVLGSDYPNIPYPYAHQIAALASAGLGDSWLRAVLYDNGARLLGPPPAVTASLRR